jgi:hypothetical protein
VFNAEHLRRILAKYATYYNEVRTHVSLGRMRPADGRSNGSATLSRIRSLADYTIAMLESSFRKRQAKMQQNVRTDTKGGSAKTPR